MTSIRRRVARYALLRVVELIAVGGFVMFFWAVIAALFSLEPQ